MISRFCTILGLCLAPPIALLQGEEMRPEFAKLAPAAPCPALVEAARTNHIPIAGLDPPGPAESLEPGDSTTALITLFEKGGRKTQWLLYVEAAAPTAERNRSVGGRRQSCTWGLETKCSSLVGWRRSQCGCSAPLWRRTAKGRLRGRKTESRAPSWTGAFLALAWTKLRRRSTGWHKPT